MMMSGESPDGLLSILCISIFFAGMVAVVTAIMLLEELPDHECTCPRTKPKLTGGAILMYKAFGVLISPIIVATVVYFDLHKELCFLHDCNIGGVVTFAQMCWAAVFVGHILCFVCRSSKQRQLLLGLMPRVETPPPLPPPIPPNLFNLQVFLNVHDPTLAFEPQIERRHVVREW